MIRCFVLTAALAVWANSAAQTAAELRRAITERESDLRQLREKLQALEQTKPPLEPEEETSRALERSLVQQGGLLLRSGSYEFEPQLGYSHWDKSRPPFRDVGVAAITLRAGLGWDSQIQMRLPYGHVTTAVGSETALGDIDLAFSRQLAREAGAWPGVLASATWTARTGKDGFNAGVPTGGGFNVFQGALTAVKRQDPLVFYGGVSYSRPLSRDIGGVTVRPGDALGLRFGGLLAASPSTSINVGMNYSFVNETRLNGVAVFDSDTVLGTLQIGVGTVLTRSMLLNFAGEVRLTGAVPDFRLTATLPIRF